ncbi:hypothetical protein BC834DRAFT_1000712 [Gloeopeniophorella convolvens]|nr:hypothetical protein BC834DRAFT_1000712 [Gloeopeniophorella convolvens]
MASVKPPQSQGDSIQKKGGRRRDENNRIYANPLPITFSQVENKFAVTALGIFGISAARVLNPRCEGVFDPATRSVWITNSKDSMILWRHGFFGKGNLSRSEPSWLVRQINIRKAAGKQMTSEEVTAKRRAERKQFKLDRARAIAAAAAEAEAAFAEGRIISAEETRTSIPSAATWKPTPSIRNAVTPPSERSREEIDDLDAEPLEDLEHMQLTLPEAFFLAWALDSWTSSIPKRYGHAVYACTANVYIFMQLEPMALPDIWRAFQAAHMPLHLEAPLGHGHALRPDNPFLVNYVFLHHYRSLGWVVKNGVKFCVDYLLYKRGPIRPGSFPVYDDPEDAKSSPYNLPNVAPFTWQWLSTINRVNSQVQKTLVLSYVTIPALSRVSSTKISSPACFEEYSVREITIRRFVPARMRD